MASQGEEHAHSRVKREATGAPSVAPPPWKTLLQQRELLHLHQPCYRSLQFDLPCPVVRDCFHGLGQQHSLLVVVFAHAASPFVSMMRTSACGRSL